MKFSLTSVKNTLKLIFSGHGESNLHWAPLLNTHFLVVYLYLH